jgi:hypothetical protein
MSITLISSIHSETISNGWVNGAAGQFRDFDNNCLYRFCATDNNLYAYLLSIQEQKKSPVLATGFIGYLVKHWGEDIQLTIENYYNYRLNEYVKVHKNDIDSDIRDLTAEFMSIHLKTEDPYFSQSKAVYEYLTDEDVALIEGYVSRYKRYVDGQLGRNNTELPKELQTSKAKALFQRAIDAGFVETNGNLYKWLGETKQLLAYFVERCSQYLGLSKKLDKDGNATTNWKVFEVAFNVAKLKNSKMDWLKVNTKFTPNGYEKIDLIFV